MPKSKPNYIVQTDLAKRKKLRAWVKALRSGKFEQGRSYLTSFTDDSFTDDGGVIENPKYNYCCLGVGCVAVLGMDPGSIESTLLPSRQLLTSLGVPRNAIHEDESKAADVLLTLESGRASKASTLNDGQDYKPNKIRQHTFKQIADIIEKNFLGRIPRRKKT